MRIIFAILLSVLFFSFLFSCKPTLIPPPTLTISSLNNNLGNITSTSISSLKLFQNGIGTISYSIESNKKWLVLSKNSGNLNSIKDSLILSTDINSNDLINGENFATLTISPIINGEPSASISVEIKGTFISTALATSNSILTLGVLNTLSTASVSLKKIGFENLSFEAISDKPWIVIDKTKGIIQDKIDLNFSIDPTNLEGGKFEGTITIIPIVNNQFQTPIKITILGFYDDIISGQITQHFLTKNEKWGRNINLLGTVTIPLGKTLTITPGTKITVKKNPEASSIKIIANGFLQISGDENNIIELKSEEPSGKGDWTGLEINGDCEISYAVIKNAIHAISFYDYVSFNNPKKAPIIHHVLFDTNFFGISSFKSIYETTFSNLTFKNITYFCYFTVGSQKTNIIDCDFLSDECYVDAIIKSDAGQLSLSNCNFTKKSILSSSHLEAFEGFKNVKVTANNCYNLSRVGGFDRNNNEFTNFNPIQIPNKNIGCGFDNKLASSRFRFSGSNAK